MEGDSRGICGVATVDILYYVDTRTLAYTTGRGPDGSTQTPTSISLFKISNAELEVSIT